MYSIQGPIFEMPRSTRKRKIEEVEVTMNKAAKQVHTYCEKKQPYFYAIILEYMWSDIRLLTGTVVSIN